MLMDHHQGHYHRYQTHNMICLRCISEMRETIECHAVGDHSGSRGVLVGPSPWCKDGFDWIALLLLRLSSSLFVALTSSLAHHNRTSYRTLSAVSSPWLCLWPTYTNYERIRCIVPRYHRWYLKGTYLPPVRWTLSSMHGPCCMQNRAVLYLPIVLDRQWCWKT